MSSPGHRETFELQRNVDRFDEGNSFLFALLGCISFGVRLERIVNQRSTPTADGAGSGISPDHSLLNVLVGLVALKVQFEQAVDNLAPTRDAAVSVDRGAAPRAGERIPSELLR